MNFSARPDTHVNSNPKTAWIAFAKSRRIASGRPRDVAQKVKAFADSHQPTSILVFDRITSEPVELDLRGSLKAVIKRLPEEIATEPADAADARANAPKAPGRPKLGVVAREVTLLPRHWSWLASQPGGASVALRKLVEHGQRASRKSDRVRQIREAAYRFMSAIAGDEAGFEEATRALFAGDQDRLRAAVVKWPADVRKHALALADAPIEDELEISLPRGSQIRSLRSQ